MRRAQQASRGACDARARARTAGALLEEDALAPIDRLHLLVLPAGTQHQREAFLQAACRRLATGVDARGREGELANTGDLEQDGRGEGARGRLLVRLGERIVHLAIHQHTEVRVHAVREEGKDRLAGRVGLEQFFLALGRAMELEREILAQTHE